MTVANPTAEVLEGASVRLWIGWKRVLSRSDLAAWADGTGGRPGTPQKTLDVPSLAAGAHIDLTFSLPVDGLRLTGDDRAPRELAITLADGRSTLAAVHSFLLWDPAPPGEGTPSGDSGARGTTPESPEPPSPEPSDTGQTGTGKTGTGKTGTVGLSLLAPMTGPALDPADPHSAGALAALTAPGGPLARTLAAVGVAEGATGTRGALAIAVDPALVATATASHDPQTTAWAGAVTGLGDRTSVSPLPAYDPDLGALAHADLGAPDLTGALTAPLPAGWSVPSTWGATVAWPAGSTPDVATLAAARAAGLSTAVVMDGLAPSQGTATGLAAVGTNAGGVTALVADQALSQVLAAATDLAGGEAPVLSAAEATQRLLAETAVVAFQNAGDEPHLLATLPRGWSPDADALHATLGALQASGWVRLAPLDELRASPVPTVERTPLPGSQPQDGELAPLEVRRLADARSAVASLAAVADDPRAVTSLVAPGLAAPVSVAWRSSPTDRSTAVDAAIDAATTLRSALTVSVVNLEVTLISAAGALPVTVRNNLPVDATVDVVLRPDDARLIIESRPTIVVAAGTEARVNVPVSALASGDVDVQVQLLTPDGAQAADPVSLQLRVRAGWETVGTAVLAGLVALLLVFGIWRTVRRGRSPRRTSDADVPDPLIRGEAERRA
ncbi:hypothetical protein ET495_12930 [Xylanimonas allomyrinae]|uniref:2-oxoglutarate dehydrogenase n=1 Tax=Xylanimonas allomyrinae TaxID=2509459 RepID=A0A4P6EQ79_9MICO|nr:DUF6049 family protein [Xylanimonas allomyrinae]QAY63983.1 hypothetical protein ET495_12930 [Xylanimonas allomyrinae]